MANLVPDAGWSSPKPSTRRAVDPSVPADPRIYLAYAQHLLFREKRAECLEIVDRALRSPLAGADAWAETAMQLHEVGIKAALSDPKDPGRLAKAGPHIQALKEAKSVRYQSLGHLFQGIIDLERSGLAADSTARGPNAAPIQEAGEAKANANTLFSVSDLDQSGDPKLRASALAHLRKAAEGLPDVSGGQGAVWHHAAALARTRARPAAPQRGAAAGQPGAALPGLGRLVDAPGRLSRGGAADRRGDAPRPSPPASSAGGALAGSLHLLNGPAPPGPLRTPAT